jgi:hypothetical protein
MTGDFFEVINSFDDDEFENHSLILTNAALISNNLNLTVQLRKLDSSAPQTWELDCLGVREHRIKLGECQERFYLRSEHVVLWAHVKPVVSLYFNGNAQDPLAIVGALYDQHCKLVNGWMPFDRWFNMASTLAALIRAGHGQLAEGPEPLIRGYERVLQEHGIGTSTFSRDPKFWNGTRWVPSTDQLVALICGRMYIVASDVHSKLRLPEVNTT